MFGDFFKQQHYRLILENDQQEHGKELEYFEFVPKIIGRKEKCYMICKMDYNNEIGFNYAKKAQCNSDDNIY